MLTRCLNHTVFTVIEGRLLCGNCGQPANVPKIEDKQIVAGEVKKIVPTESTRMKIRVRRKR